MNDLTNDFVTTVAEKLRDTEARRGWLLNFLKEVRDAIEARWMLECEPGYLDTLVKDAERRFASGELDSGRESDH